MLLITPYYCDNNSARQSELQCCLERNIASGLFDRVVLLADDSCTALQTVWDKEQVVLVPMGRRCTYRDCIEYANQHHAGEVVVIANSDIFFDETIALLQDKILCGEWLALTRWDVRPDAGSAVSECCYRPDSQDVWAFRSPLPDFPSDFELGKPGCDNRIAWEAHNSGLKVTNPSLTVRCHHLHLSQVRNYNNQQKIPGPYLFVQPINIGAVGHPAVQLVTDGYKIGNWSVVNAHKLQLNAQVPALKCALPGVQFVRQPMHWVSVKRTLAVAIVHRGDRAALELTLASLSGVGEEQFVVASEGTDAVEAAEQYAARVTFDNLNILLAQLRTDWVLVLYAGEVLGRKMLDFLERLSEQEVSDNIGTDNLWLQKFWASPTRRDALLGGISHGEDFECRLFRLCGGLRYRDPLHGIPEGFQRPGQHLEGLEFFSFELFLNTRQQRLDQVLALSRDNFLGGRLVYLMPEQTGYQEQAWELDTLSLPVRERVLHLPQVNSSNSSTVAQPPQPQVHHPLIAIDGVFFQLHNTGITQLWTMLLREWSKTEFSRHLVILDRGYTAPRIKGLRYLPLPLYDCTSAEREQLERVCRTEGLDLFASTYYSTPLETPSVFMGYDMIPEAMGWDMDEPHWQEKQRAIAHAAHHIVISESTARDLVNFYPGVQREQVTVAYPGVKPIFTPAPAEEVDAFRRQYGLERPYFLFVGKRVRYKNALLAFLALAELPHQDAFDIVCVGGGPLEEELACLATGRTVHLLLLGDGELRLAYCGAEALLYPSRYEGFGLPIVEAMACGCPVITCCNSSIPEVAGEAVLYVGETNVAEMTAALQVVRNPEQRAKLVEMGYQQAERFSWKQMADTTRRALIGATLPTHSPEGRNWLVCPDWQADEEELLDGLAQVVQALAAQPESGLWTLLVDARADQEAANLALSTVIGHLCLFESFEPDSGPQISLVGALAPLQRQELLTRVAHRVEMTPQSISTDAIEIPALSIAGSAAEIAPCPA